VKIELGHRATVKKIPSPEGFTHDWTVYVRGPENCNISYFIEKVVFNLHASFHNPKRGRVYKWIVQPHKQGVVIKHTI
jgi:YEATS domain-containing protein 1/3